MDNHYQTYRRLKQEQSTLKREIESLKKEIGEVKSFNDRLRRSIEGAGRRKSVFTVHSDLK